MPIYSNAKRTDIGNFHIDFTTSLSNYGGLPMAMARLKQCGFLGALRSALEPTFPKERENSSRHRVKGFDLLLQRLAALICGREDLVDITSLSQDPLFSNAVGKENLVSYSTLSRFENSITDETIERGNEFLQDMYLRYGRRGSLIVIDVDNTPVELFGYQEHHKFNGHYGCNCYLPLLAFIGGFPVGVFNGNEDGRVTVTKMLKPLVQKIRARSKQCPVILLRADSGFNGKELIDLCEELGIFYIIGLSPNKALNKTLEKLQPQFMEVLHRGNDKGSVLRHIGEVEDYMAKSWTGPRRVIVRDYWNDKLREWDARYIQTNIPKEKSPKSPCGGLWKLTAAEIYDQLYCQRGMDEKYNQR